MRVLLDSGAYSAWTQGTDIDLDDYIQFIKRNEQHLDRYVSLDVIPGVRGQPATDPGMIEEAARASYRNFQVMMGAGLRPIPVFHQSESFDWLERYLEDGAPYIGLSPWKRGGWGRSSTWLDICFDRLARDRHNAPRVHGFGVTSPFLCLRYPWGSTDSTRWLRAAFNGQVPYVSHGPDGFDYTVQPKIVQVTDRSRHLANHIDDLTDLQRDDLRTFLHDVVGIDLPEARYSIDARRRTWLRYFLGLQSAHHSCPALLRHRSDEHRGPFEIAFVTDTGPQLRGALDQCDADLCLLSFDKLRRASPRTLEHYAGGRVSTKPQMPPRRARQWNIEHRKLSLYLRHQHLRS
jgi:hypothetical protein